MFPKTSTFDVLKSIFPKTSTYSSASLGILPGLRWSDQFFFSLSFGGTCSDQAVRGIRVVRLWCCRFDRLLSSESYLAWMIIMFQRKKRYRHQIRLLLPLAWNMDECFRGQWDCQNHFSFCTLHFNVTGLDFKPIQYPYSPTMFLRSEVLTSQNLGIQQFWPLICAKPI